MKNRKYLLSTILILAVLSLLFITACTNTWNIGPRRSLNSENAYEDRYIVKETEYNIATYDKDPVIKPIVSQFNNISRQKTLNARLNALNEMIGMNQATGRNEQLYQTYKIHQKDCYLFSCEYFTVFDTTVTNKGVNMLIGSEIDGTLLVNFLALFGTNQEWDSWKEFFVLFEEARIAAGAKEITKEYMTTDNVSYVFEGEDLTDLIIRILYKVPDDTEQQEVPMKLNDIKGCLSERMQVYMSFTEDASMTYEEYALNIEEYRLNKAYE